MTATLTVTDNGGGADTLSKDVIVAPPARFMCNGSPCDIILSQSAVVTVTLQASDCHAHNDVLIITSPVVDTLFTDGCYVFPVPHTFQLNGGNSFAAGTHLQAEVISGSTELSFTPSMRVTGSFPTWTLEFDDGQGCPGADPTCGGLEPDFNDLVLTVTATP